MRVVFIFMAVALAGCNTPSAQFVGSQSSTVNVDGSTYTVFHRGDRAQALRTNAEWRPNRGAEAKIRSAIQQATGCRVVGKLKGDVVMANARVNCGDGSREWEAETERFEIDCDLSQAQRGRAYCTGY